jgi:hypothetical protein
MCVAAPAYVGTDLAHQREQLRWFGGMVGNHVADLVARYGTDGPVPRELTDYISGRQAYDYSHHGQAGNPSTDFVPDEIVDRFCLLGPASAHIERLRELAEIGADQFAVYLMHDDEENTLAAYGDEIIPALTLRSRPGWPPEGGRAAGVLARQVRLDRPPGHGTLMFGDPRQVSAGGADAAGALP